MPKKSRAKKTGKGEGEPPGKPTCDLESPAPALSTAGWTAVVNSVRRSRYLQLLVLFTIFGAFLRIFQLGAAPLWLDEATTLTYARQSLSQIWGSVSSGSEFHPPLFYWMEHAMLIFGESEVVLRLFPALFGIFTIPVFYFVGAEILDRNTGILAAALLTFSPFHIYYSQEARDYAMMLFFFSLAFLFFLRLLKSWGRRDALLFGAFSALAFWAHFYAFVPILALFIFALCVKAKGMLEDLRSAIPLVTSLLVFSLLSLPLVYYAVRLFSQITGAAPTFGIQGIATVTMTFSQLSGFSEILAFAFLALSMVGMASLFFRDRVKATLLVYALVFPLLLSIFLSYRMPMQPRYLIYLLAAFLPGVAAAIGPACTIIRSRNLVYGALILSLVINLPVLFPYYTTPQKDDWRGFGQILAGKAAPGDAIIVVPGYVRQPLDYYYRNETDGTIEFGAYTVPDLENITSTRGNRTVWYVVTGDLLSIDAQGKIGAWLDEHTASGIGQRIQHGGILLLRSGAG
jgi:4-amino-4-deoxy-L-arabinose transferase-like glycosyltransferase